MKILFVKKLYSPVGGSETLTYEWARRLAARGHEVRVVCLWPHRQRYNFPPPVMPLNHGRHFRSFVDGGVHVYQLAPHAGPVGKVADLLPFSQMMRRGLALDMAGDCDIVHNVCREYAGVARAIAASRRVPLVLTPLPHPGQPFSGDSAADQTSYLQAQGIVAMTAHERRWYEAMGVPAERVAVVGAGASVAVKADGVAFRERHGIKGPLVLFVGRQERYKGYIATAAAGRGVWKAHPETSFVFIGEKGLLCRLYDPLSRYRDPRIVDLQVVESQEKAAAFAACDIFCMPSTHETLGITYLEAWTHGKPVVGCDIPPLREVISNGVDGLLVTQEPGAIAAALIRLLADPALARRMGKEGRRKVEQLYSWPVVIDKLEGFYRRLAEENVAGG